ncbi:MAG: 1,4-alpha-glucan branching protein GlgB [Lachnospiraceae bacterium]|nr:1,4-alpha-glucan branching protein GlgB [Lachnospiraceae bacterium]
MAVKKNTTQIGLGVITDVDRYLFGQGTHYEIYDKMGAHPMTLNGKAGIYFAVWAPHAEAVSVVGDFNGWDSEASPMEVLDTSGIYEAFVPGLGTNELYKFAITTQSGKVLLKADPYAQYAEYRPGTASITADISSFGWTDDAWMAKRLESNPRESAMSIYEVHIGSWKKKAREEHEGFYTYKEAAQELADYVKDMGYTHVELMGIAEHPYDGSWGYQVTGYYAPTSRYGTPEEFMYFVNYLHKKGIGILLDWVPAHFPKDAHGLADFDGQPLYEYADPRKGEHPDWGTNVFDYSKHEVSNFLIANALYWVDKFHVDGLRVDAVASMLYLDYGRQDGQWIPNEYGGNQNLEAIEFFRHLNSIMGSRGHGAMVIAEESTAWPLVTHDPKIGGLGFTFKWNMGWMHDFLEYMKLDPYFRKFNHNKMTFGLSYFNSENFILVLSHDEVVHLKCSMLNKMPGEFEEKFANLKAGYTFMMGHPGKKLLFMGQDFGQLHEWDEKVALDWYLTEEPLHGDLKNYVRDLLHIYQKYPALYESDDDWDGFQWINANDNERSIFSFVRYAKNHKKSLMFIGNFTPVPRPDYRVGVPKRGNYTLLLDNEHGMYTSAEKAPVLKAVKQECDGQPYSIALPLSAYGTAILRFS